MYSRTKLGIVAIAGLLFLLIISRLFQSVFPSKNGPLTTPSFFQSFNFSKTFSFEFESNSLKKVIQKELDGKKGSFAIYVENLNTQEKYGVNENASYPAASLYKLVLMAATLKEVEDGNLKMDTVISGNKSRLTDILGSVDFGYEDREEDIEYTVEEALTRVGRISDNFAAIMLTDKLRTIKAGEKDEGLLIVMAKELGMSNTDFSADPISITATDVATFFRRLYSGQVVSKDASDKIIGYLGESKINDRIPAGVEEGVRVTHKTGELSKVRNDAGIVYLDGNPYLIVMLSKDLEYEDDGVETMVNISKAVYKYFQEKVIPTSAPTPTAKP